jgi:hypothetical protein
MPTGIDTAGTTVTTGTAGPTKGLRSGSVRGSAADAALSPPGNPALPEDNVVLPKIDGRDETPHRARHQQ